MTPLPPPADLTSLVLRTDFTDDPGWAALRAEMADADADVSATYADDPGYARVTVQQLVDADAAADEDDKLMYLFLADAVTMADDEHLLLAVDLHDEPGRTFRVPPARYPDVSTNLAIANMDFADFADDVDETGTYRG
jgi:hypothetical protein